MDVVNKTDVAILVSKHYALNHHKYDIALKFELGERGYKAQIVAWDDDFFDFEKTKVAVIRSCWDYDQRVDEFHRKMLDISKKTQLVNDINTILHNSSKFYLKDLQEKGIHIIPTDFIRSERDIDVVIDTFDAENQSEQSESLSGSVVNVKKIIENLRNEIRKFKV